MFIHPSPKFLEHFYDHWLRIIIGYRLLISTSLFFFWGFILFLIWTIFFSCLILPLCFSFLFFISMYKVGCYTSQCERGCLLLGMPCGPQKFSRLSSPSLYGLGDAPVQAAWILVLWWGWLLWACGRQVCPLACLVAQLWLVQKLWQVEPCPGSDANPLVTGISAQGG